jgi:hypothetical protein
VEEVFALVSRSDEDPDKKKPFDLLGESEILLFRALGLLTPPKLFVPVWSSSAKALSSVMLGL